MRRSLKKEAGSGLDRARGGHQQITRQLCANTKPLTQRSAGAFTLVEVVVVMAIVLIAIAGAFGTIRFMNFSSLRLADTTAGLAQVQAQLEQLRTTPYNPPDYPFDSTSTRTLTTNVLISLNQAGTTFRVPGTITSTIQPVAEGHMVTVTGTFTNADQFLNPSFTVTLQTVINRFTGGQQ